jgi:hypothetical protein
MIDRRPDAHKTRTSHCRPPRVRRGRSKTVRGCVLGSLFALVAVLMWSGTALADSASVSVTTTSGQSDPTAGVPRIFTVSGVASVPEYVYVKSRAPGGAPCAPTADSDTGSTIEEYGDWGYGEEVNGDFSFQKVFTWEPPGTEVFCIWLASSGSAITTPITQTITFRVPNGTITATVNPITPTPGEKATITVTGSSEAPEKVFAKIRPSGGAPCAQTYNADSGSNLIDEDEVNGAFTEQATTTQATTGTYLICLWLAGSPNDTSPIAGPQPETFTVAAPLPPPPPPPPAPSAECLRDRGGVAHEELLIRRYEGKLRARHLSRRAKRKDERSLAAARKAASSYEGLRRHQCPNGK